MKRVAIGAAFGLLLDGCGARGWFDPETQAIFFARQGFGCPFGQCAPATLVCNDPNRQCIGVWTTENAADKEIWVAEFNLKTVSVSGLFGVPLAATPSGRAIYEIGFITRARCESVRAANPNLTTAPCRPAHARFDEPLPSYSVSVDISSRDSEGQDVTHGPYFTQVRELIKQNWKYPCVKDLASGRCEYKTTKVVVAFEILPNGRIPRPVVHETSGYAIYDDYAKNAVMLGSPFPPPPTELMALAKSGSAAIRLLAVFNYLGTKSGDGR
jgi:hypothetical protein